MHVIGESRHQRAAIPWEVLTVLQLFSLVAVNPVTPMNWSVGVHIHQSDSSNTDMMFQSPISPCPLGWSGWRFVVLSGCFLFPRKYLLYLYFSHLYPYLTFADIIWVLWSWDACLTSLAWGELSVVICRSKCMIRGHQHATKILIFWQLP